MNRLIKVLNTKHGPLISTLIVLVTAGIVIIIVLSLAGCAPSEGVIQTAVVGTRMAYPTQSAYPTYTPYPTLTPYPTSTPWVITITPSQTPIITPTPIFDQLSAQKLIDGFKTSGLEAQNIRDMTQEDYGIAPKLAVTGLRFFIPSLCSDCGGRILEFDDPMKLKITQTYYETVNKSGTFYFSWLFIHDNILVQINGYLPEDQAMKYKQVLESLKP